ncbi:hypothetical protein [Mycolicibacterium fluoranthenivorans]|uniref:Uncharacterized protein n=1 Tax=Mycolicibacterium fluoranthenivorans TaxID=258505 RepID=A0A7X5ZG61_9MYCO|nr:hypothetical protein [Mycolicibacterium fluoranthenivorans]MCV7359162.1 hypothetical protein [Mycolicibacterium fluoranthenivorans]NIH98951.1 hypothetical protein [Mycolicibacterium fluoranthenivorans]
MNSPQMLPHVPDDGREWRTVATLINGEPMFSTLGLSILTGYPEAFVATEGNVSALAIQAGRRRASEAAAATGSRDLDFCLPYLADQMGLDLANPDPFEIVAARRVS